MGTSRFDEDLAYYRDVIGAELVWSFHRFGTRVAAIDERFDRTGVRTRQMTLLYFR